MFTYSAEPSTNTRGSHLDMGTIGKNQMFSFLSQNQVSYIDRTHWQDIKQERIKIEDFPIKFSAKNIFPTILF